MTTEAVSETGIRAGNGHDNGLAFSSNEATNFAAKLFSSLTATNDVSNGGNVIVSPLLLEATIALLYLGSDGVTAEQLQSLLEIEKRYTSNAKMANFYAAQLATAIQKSDNCCDATKIPSLSPSSSPSPAAAAATMGITKPMTTPSSTSTATCPATSRILLCSKILLPENFEVSDVFRKIAQKYFHTQATTRQQLQTDELLMQICGKDYVAHLLQTTTATAATTTATESSASAVSFVAAHFENKWFLPFSAYRTGLYDFNMDASGPAMQEQREEQQEAPPPPLPPSTKSVAMLFDDDMFVKFGEFRELDARAIELPYEWDEEDDELAMLLLLPNKRDGLPALLQQLGGIDLTSLTERMQMESVQVLLPKFKIDFESSLRLGLEQLGISAVFGEDANFKNLLPENSQKSLHFQDMIHKVSIEVNETGSAASKNLANPLKPIVISNSLNGRKKFFRADHPFYFAVRSRDSIYFMGQVKQL